ncbi:hypothetical protein FB451DRAFT_1520301 [Mycena latifolia]|nr:hypothetical protein FB451DRAFT_1520301 [Mycena latifolia]
MFASSGQSPPPLVDTLVLKASSLLFLALFHASFCPTLPSLFLFSLTRGRFGSRPHGPSVAFAYGFSRARVPFPSDTDFPAAFPRCVVKPRRPGRPNPPHTHKDSLSSYSQQLRAKRGFGSKRRFPSSLHRAPDAKSPPTLPVHFDHIKLAQEHASIQGSCIDKTDLVSQRISHLSERQDETQDILSKLHKTMNQRFERLEQMMSKLPVSWGFELVAGEASS